MRRHFRVLLLISVGAASACGGARAQSSATTTGISRDFNPAISVNSLFVAKGFAGREKDGDSTAAAAFVANAGVELQEIELQLSAAIDPYTTADIIFAFEEGEVEVEEAYVTTTALPGNIGLRAGQMLLPLGFENALHSHQLAFVQRSLFAATVFEETLADFGAEVSYLAPFDSYLDVHVGVFNGDDAAVFDAPGDRDLLYTSGADALWDLSENKTLALGGDYLVGPNSTSNDDETALSHLFATEARFKWSKPSPTSPRTLDVVAEFVYVNRDCATPAADRIDHGVYAQASYRFSRRWWVQGRYDRVTPEEAGEAQRGTLQLAFVPSEFAALRLQTAVLDTARDTQMEFWLQYNFTIGSHPAHRY